MEPKTCRWVFFDAAGTLFGLRGSVGQIYGETARRYGAKATVAEIEEQFRRVFAASPPMAFSGVAEAEIVALEKRWWYALVWKVFEPLGRFDRFDPYFEELYDWFQDGRGWEVFPDVLPVLERLRSNSINAGVISNFDSRLFSVLKSLGLNSYFGPVIISSCAGVAKPDPLIFRAALHRSGAQAAASLFIGDHPEEDYAGAARVGMRPLLIDRRGQYTHRSDLKRIVDLNELMMEIDD